MGVGWAGCQVAVTCRDGFTYHGEVVIGADGLDSTVRPLVVADELHPTGCVAYRGAVPVQKVDRRVGLDEVVAGDSVAPCTTPASAARYRKVSSLRQNPNDNDIEVQQRDPQPMVSVRTTVPVAELATVQGDALRALWDHLRRHRVRPAGPPFVRYHTFGDVETDVEVGIPVADAAAGEGRVDAGTLPGGTVVSAWHLGSHDGLGDAYTRLQVWLKEHGHQPAGAGWEVYHWIDLDGEPNPAAWPDPSTWRTQLIQPIR